jgi:hypothetical protein
LDKTDWTAEANSWDTRSGASNRPAGNLIDNDLISKWHPCVTAGGCGVGNYQNTAVPDGNYVITIDTKGETNARGFTLLQRNDGNGNHVKKITVEVGNTPESYTEVGSFDLEVGADAVGKEQVVFFGASKDSRNFRYIRFKINRGDVNGDASSNAVLNELGLFN